MWVTTPLCSIRSLSSPWCFASISSIRALSTKRTRTSLSNHPSPQQNGRAERAQDLGGEGSVCGASDRAEDFMCHLHSGVER